VFADDDINKKLIRGNKRLQRKKF